MKTLKTVAACTIACAVAFVAPTRGVEPKATPPQQNAREQAVKQYFAPPATPQPKPDANDPKWVESMQRLLKDLSADNAKLRTENAGLRADNDALKWQLQEYEALMRRLRENRGAFEIPREAVPPPVQRGDQVPQNWRPFEFNGATYYVIPLEHQAPRAKGLAGKAPPSVDLKGGTVILPEASK